MKTAGKPSQPIEKSTAGASLLTQVIVAKFADHLPLYRQAKIFRRFGVELSDRTMCGWMRQCADLLDPLYMKLKDFVLASKVVGTDDTRSRCWIGSCRKRAKAVSGRMSETGIIRP